MGIKLPLNGKGKLPQQRTNSLNGMEKMPQHRKGKLPQHGKGKLPLNGMGKLQNGKGNKSEHMGQLQNGKGNKSEHINLAHTRNPTRNTVCMRLGMWMDVSQVLKLLPWVSANEHWRH